MRKLNLENYTVKVRQPDPMKLGEMIDAEMPYNFKDSILNLLFYKDLELDGFELVRQNILATKIETCKASEVLLEEDEYQRVKRAVAVFKGFNRHDVELVTRVNEAAEIEVEPVKEK